MDATATEAETIEVGARREDEEWTVTAAGAKMDDTATCAEATPDD